jgi:hypothetical protein
MIIARLLMQILENVTQKLRVYELLHNIELLKNEATPKIDECRK